MPLLRVRAATAMAVEVVPSVRAVAAWLAAQLVAAGTAPKPRTGGATAP